MLTIVHDPVENAQQSPCMHFLFELLSQLGLIVFTIVLVQQHPHIFLVILPDTFLKLEVTWCGIDS